MAVNLLDLVSRAITPDAIQGISRFLGEGDSAVQSGIGTLVPALLGGMASKASTPSGASNLLSMINSPNVDTNLVGNIGSMLGSGQSSSLLQLGSSLLGGLFGPDKATGAASALAGVTGMKGASATNLLMMAVPIVFSVLKRFIGENRLDAGGLASLFAGQKDFLAGKLDPRLTSGLGLGSPASVLSGLGETARSGAAAVGAAGAAAGSAAVAGASGIRRWLPWLIAAAIAVLLLSQFQQYGTTVKKEAAPVATTPAPATTSPAPAPASPAQMGAGSLPAKIYFETGKSELNTEGSAVVKSVASALAANPSAKVDLTGFTDKTGDTAANEELAKKRAMSVRSALETAGVAADRVNTKPPMFVEIGAAGGSDAEARRVDIAAAR
jgi:outer membrane protein OmpA-like peptidoglycan-associated protein